MNEAVAVTEEPTAFVHVYPTFGRAHITDGGFCWCWPDPDDDNPLVLIHHAEQ